MRIAATLIFTVSIAALLSSCSKGGEGQTPTGYKFTYIKKGDGKVVKPGQVLVMDMAIVDDSDSVWYDNRVTDYPEIVRIADESKKEAEIGVVEAFRMLSKGDSILFGMRAKDIFPIVWRADAPEGVKDDAMFTFQILCRDILDEAAAKKFQGKLDSIHRAGEAARYAEAEREMIEYKKQQLGKDTVIIDNYLESKNIKATSLPSGLRYVLKSKGEGATITNGDMVNVKYAGQTLDGREFDSGEYSFNVGRREVIDGWDLIVLNMKKGSSLTVFVPSSLAYSRGGRPPVIMPDAILIFDMEILSVKK